MIRIENVDVMGWEPAIRGMRNPMNSWEKSDSIFHIREDIDHDHMEYREFGTDICGRLQDIDDDEIYNVESVKLGPNDKQLMLDLAMAGPVHAKYRRMITVYCDITAPLYWWKEFDTYKVGTVANSCSTMHKIHSKEFTPDDFSIEHLIVRNDAMSTPEVLRNEEWVKSEYEDAKIDIYDDPFFPSDIFGVLISMLNVCREGFLRTKDKKYWWQMIQLLPSSYNQKRTVMMNYEVLSNIYQHRKDHKLDEWRELCKWIETLPFSEIITVRERRSRERN